MRYGVPAAVRLQVLGAMLQPLRLDAVAAPGLLGRGGRFSVLAAAQLPGLRAV